MQHIKYAFISLLLLFAVTSSGQDREWTVQLSGGPTIFYGDIMDHELYFPELDNSTAWNFSGAITLGKRISPVFSLRGQLLYGKLGGTRMVSNRYFEADIFDYSLQARIDINNIFAASNPYRFLNIYGLVGVGLSNWNTDLKDATTDQVIASSGGVDVGMLEMTTEGFVPAGLGIDFRLSDRLRANLEATIRLTNSDRLDASEGGSKYDMYSYTSLGLTYSFGKSKARRKKDLTNTSHYVKPLTDKPVVTDTVTQPEKPFEVSVESEMPGEIIAGQSFAVNIVLHKGDISGPATVRQVFPEGFEVQPLALAGGDFNFLSQVFTINWNELPFTKSVKLTYRVKTDNVKAGTYPISGIFTYTQDNNSKLKAFKNTIVVNAPVITTQEEPQATDFNSGSSYERNLDFNNSTVFRVQIRARYRTKMSIESLQRKYNLDERIYESYHNGYYIYTTGNFATYEQARAFRQTLTYNNGVKDAFVVVFVNGKRLDKLSDLKKF